MPRDVRSYTRTSPSGKPTQVRRHTRRGNPFRPGEGRKRKGPNPAHAVKLGKRARAARRKGRKGIAAAFIALAIGEVVAWLTLSTTSAVLALAAGVLAFLSYALVSMTGENR